MRVVRSTLPLEADPLPRVETIERAADFAADTFARVALVEMPSLDARADTAGRVRVFLALENLQVTGSFKVRGATFAIARQKEQGVTRVVTASAGNHGAGVAWAAKRLGAKATIVVPRSAPEKKITAIRGYGGEAIDLVVHGDGYDAAEAHALALAAAENVPFLSPYDDVDVVAGNGGSLAREIHEAMSGPFTVVAPIGGGGLATGLACGFAVQESRGYGEERIVWGAQSEASAAFALSLERGSAVETLPYAETLADGLEGGISARAFARAKGVLAGAVVVTEEEIARAIRFSYDELGLVIEGSAAAALVPAINGNAAALRRGTEQMSLVVVLTGRNIDRARLSRIVAS